MSNNNNSNNSSSSNEDVITDYANSVYNKTTINRESENNISFFQTLVNFITKKPVKKLYRLCLLALLALVANNTTVANISDLLIKVLQQSECQNYTMTKQSDTG